MSELFCLVTFFSEGAGRSSEVERLLMVRWVIGLILHGVDPLSYFSFQPVLHDWCNKGRGMCYPVCGMVHIKEPLLLIDKSSLCGGSWFPFSLSEWSLTICLTPYNRRYNVLSASLNKTFVSLSLFSDVLQREFSYRGVRPDTGRDPGSDRLHPTE